jgi:hypothetical protein
MTISISLPSSNAAEIAHEIAGHNADDVGTLRAMALVSKTTRSVAITHLFSRIHFACVEDFSQHPLRGAPWAHATQT